MAFPALFVVFKRVSVSPFFFLHVLEHGVLSCGELERGFSKGLTSPILGRPLAFLLLRLHELFIAFCVAYLTGSATFSLFVFHKGSS